MFLKNKILGKWKSVNNYIFQEKTVARAYIVCVHKEGQARMKTRKVGSVRGKNQLFKELLWEK